LEDNRERSDANAESSECACIEDEEEIGCTEGGTCMHICISCTVPNTCDECKGENREIN